MLWQALGSGKQVWHASSGQLQEVLNFRQDRIERIMAVKRRQNPAAMLAKIQRAGAWVLSFADEHYPSSLRQLFDPPIVIYGWGQPLASYDHHLAVVGSRRMTSYGRRMTEQLLAGLVASNVVIISGLALGIDGEAHRVALKNGMATWAVLGSGFGHLYPRQHRDLARQIIASGGTLLSEYWPDAKPEPHHFPARNRIIAALAEAVLVVEADEKSGTLITVDHALELGKDVWAVPGNATSRFSRGTNNLLRQGASLIASSQDILAEWGWAVARADSAAEETTPQLGEKQDLVYDQIGYQATSLDVIVQQSGLPTATVLAALTELELTGWIEVAAAQSYRRTPLKT